MTRPAAGDVLSTAIEYATLRIERALVDVRARHEANAGALRALNTARASELGPRSAELLTDTLGPLWVAFADIRARLSGK